MLFLGKTLTLRNLAVGSQDPIIITYEVTATIGVEEKLNTPSVQVIQNRIIRLIPGLGCTPDVCQKNRVGTCV